MKIQPSTHPQTPQFKAGLTKQFRNEIRHCNPTKISNELNKIGIPSDFKNNKVIAWCSFKCTEIINEFNKRYNLNLSLPKGIFVEEFSELIDVEPEALATCNISRDRLHPNSKKVTKEQTILINQFSREGQEFWNNIDEIADDYHSSGVLPTNHFLEIFLHEFGHSIHEGFLINKLKYIPALLKIFDTLDEAYLNKFQTKYDKIISQEICEYAATAPMETIACDLSRRIITNLNPDTLEPTGSFMKNSPYKHSKASEQDELQKAIKRFWNGNFKI